MSKLDEDTLSEVIKNILERDEFEGADEITTMGIIDIIESSIVNYNELTKKKVNRKYKNRGK
ncbi:MAG: hypothetical protein CMG00_05970 [Candidatus Marinimicrobia bacterium]|nr:hypothetical protein [Candidatus Neomarinimicrobiota bacterium]|tara:strand:+ start:2123 stop:2308 length:186 start_codon:yes stop_codon:yes gene_type:complete